MSPLIGILLGPYIGALAVGLGTLVGHFVYFRDIFELVFMIGAPLGAAVAGLVYQHRWKPVFGVYTILLLGYFLYPVSWILPLWGIWDILAGYGVLLLFILLVTRDLIPQSGERRRLLNILFATVIGLEADVLLRVFILVPGQTYWLFYGFTPEMLQLIWLVAGIITPLKVAMATLVGVTVGLSLLRILPHQIDLRKEHPDED